MKLKGARGLFVHKLYYCTVTTVGSAAVQAAAFCLLYKLFKKKVTVKGENLSSCFDLLSHSITYFTPPKTTTPPPHTHTHIKKKKKKETTKLNNKQQNRKHQTFEQCGPSRKDNVGIESFPEVNVWLLYGIGQHLMDPLTLLPYQVRSEQQLGRSESSWPNLKQQGQKWSGQLIYLIGWLLMGGGGGGRGASWEGRSREGKCGGGGTGERSGGRGDRWRRGLWLDSRTFKLFISPYLFFSRNFVFFQAEFQVKAWSAQYFHLAECTWTSLCQHSTWHWQNLPPQYFHLAEYTGLFQCPHSPPSEGWWTGSMSSARRKWTNLFSHYKVRH